MMSFGCKRNVLILSVIGFCGFFSLQSLRAEVDQNWACKETKAMQKADRIVQALMDNDRKTFKAACDRECNDMRFDWLQPQMKTASGKSLRPPARNRKAPSVTYDIHGADKILTLFFLPDDPDCVLKGYSIQNRMRQPS